MTQEVPANHDALSGVKQRLQTQIHEALSPQAKRRQLIVSQMDKLKQTLDRDPHGDKAGQALSESLQRYRDPGAETKPNREQLENEAVAYLALRLEQDGITVTRPDGTKAVEKITLRPEQIEAVCILLEKNHLQAATGFGKSKYVLPITATVAALTHLDPIFVAAVSPELRSELENYTGGMADLLPEAMRPLTYQHHKDEAFAQSQHALATQANQQVKAVVNETAGKPEPDISTERNNYFDQLLQRSPVYFTNTKTDKPVAYTEVKDQTQPTIFFFDEDQLVFHTMREPGLRIGHIYLDEIHVPYSRGGGYFINQENEAATPEANTQYLFKRITIGLMKEIVSRENLFRQQEGLYIFADGQAENRLYRLVQAAGQLADGQGAVAPDRELASTYLKQALQPISTATGLSLDQLQQWYLPLLTSQVARQREIFQVPQTLQEQQAAQTEPGHLDSHGIFDELALSLQRSLTMAKGVHYMKDQDGHINPRDYFMGLEMPERKYNTDIMLGIQAWNNQYEFLDAAKSIDSFTLFTGWAANRVRGKISGLSGNLYTPTLSHVNHLKKTVLARFLEEHSGRACRAVGAEKKVPPPTPSIFTDLQEMNQQLVNAIRYDTQHHQAIVFCFNESEAAELAERFKAQFGAEAVLLADAAKTETEAKILYDRFANRSQRPTILISTGRVGVGVDIKTSAGQFTDHKSYIYGLPFSVNQVYQAMGRRRLASQHPDKDFTWLINLDQLDRFPAYQELNEAAQAKLKDKLRKNPLAALDRLAYLSENLAIGAYDFSTQYDKIFQERIKDVQQKMTDMSRRRFTDLEKRLKELGNDNVDLTLLNQFCSDIYGMTLPDYFSDKVGVPSSIYHDIINQLHLQVFPAYSLNARVSDVFNEWLADDAKFNDWIDTKLSPFAYFANEILLKKLKDLRFYPQLRQAEKVSFKMLHSEPADRLGLFSSLDRHGDYVRFDIKANHIDPKLNFIGHRHPQDTQTQVVCDYKQGDMIQLYPEDDYESLARFRTGENGWNHLLVLFSSGQPTATQS